MVHVRNVEMTAQDDVHVRVGSGLEGLRGAPRYVVRAELLQGLEVVMYHQDTGVIRLGAVEPGADFGLRGRAELPSHDRPPVGRVHTEHVGARNGHVGRQVVRYELLEALHRHREPQFRAPPGEHIMVAGHGEPGRLEGVEHGPGRLELGRERALRQVPAHGDQVHTLPVHILDDRLDNVRVGNLSEVDV